MKRDGRYERNWQQEGIAADTGMRVVTYEAQRGKGELSSSDTHGVRFGGERAERLTTLKGKDRESIFGSCHFGASKVPAVGAKWVGGTGDVAYVGLGGRGGSLRLDDSLGQESIS